MIDVSRYKSESHAELHENGSNATVVFFVLFQRSSTSISIITQNRLSLCLTSNFIVSSIKIMLTTSRGKKMSRILLKTAIIRKMINYCARASVRANDLKW